jgi:hypothetical protein
VSTILFSFDDVELTIRILCRYFLWAKERFKQGEHPARFSIDVKPPKVVRGWGPRVQKGIRVRGRRRPGER